MKIIKKLCIPLFSLVLVLSCFSVSQMDASAAMSANDHIGPGSNQGGGEHLRSSDIRYPAELVGVICQVRIGSIDGSTSHCPCSSYHDNSVIYPINGDPYGTVGTCSNCWHLYSDHTSGGGSYVPSHTHNYSTTWGAWRKISSCRLPG